MERWALIASLVLNLIMIVGALTGSLQKVWRWLRARWSASESAIPIPSRTLRILPQPHPNALQWHLGARGEAPVMQIVGDFLVTNVTKLDVMVPAAKLRKPTTVGFATVRASDSNLHGQYPISPGDTSDLRFLIWVEPPVRKKGETFRADVALIDQFGNEHWMKKLEFKYS
jgi:hypothetical protein